MTSLIFNLDDAVETTNGTRFKISQIWKKPDGSLAYSDFNLRWFSAGDLRLVEEELKIGDWVEVISEGYVKGKILQIKALKDSCGQVLAGNIYFGPDSLRKLTPEEIQQHSHPKIELSQEAKDKIRALVSDAITGKSHIGINERLSAIEKRLAFVEKFQRDQDDLVGRAMRDGVAEILDFRRKA